MDITGKRVLITGASSGIGAATAIAFSNAGAARLLLLGRNTDKLRETASRITYPGCVVSTYAIDLANPDEVEKLTAQIIQDHGTPDIIINNAGSGQWKYLEETSPEEIRAMMATPYFAAAYLIRAFLPGMLSRNSGHIVNISSVASRFVWPGATAYTAARWAIRGLTQALRADLAGTNIGITLYESGEVESPYWNNNPGSRERVPKISRMIPVLTPEQVAAAIVSGVRKNKRLIVVPFMMKVIYLQHFLFPWIVQWLMTTTGYKRKNR